MLPEPGNIYQRNQATLVSNEIEALLDPLSHMADLRNLIRESLAGITRKTAGENSRYKPWYLLPLVVCESISGAYEFAVPASASILLFMAAAEVFDDIEDADLPQALSAKYGSAIATNLGTTLLILAEKALVRLKERGVTDQIIVQIMDAVNSLYLNACGGQHLDLSLACDTTMSEDTYLRIASTKSASTIECACHIGALAAIADRELVDSYVLFGRNLGMASQIANDIQGIIDTRDIANKKVTLPVIYALAHAEDKPRHQLELAFSKLGDPTLGIAKARELLFTNGAMFYTTVMMEHYKQCALDALVKIGEAGFDMERLKSFL
jgi:geranylgeranyl pyrophosphate synthase